MAYAVNTAVRVADQSSAYRLNRGRVMAVNGNLHEVRLDGHGCRQRVLLRTDQLKVDYATQPTNYVQCA